MHTVQEKCLLASKYTDDICEVAMALLVKIFNTHGEERMKIFLGNLHYINDWFQDFNNAYAGRLFYPSSIVFRHKKNVSKGDRDVPTPLPSSADRHKRLHKMC